MDFLRRESESTIESERIVVLQRPYIRGDLREMYEICQECQGMGISPRVSLSITTGGRTEEFLREFKLNRNGVETFLERHVDEGDRLKVDFASATAVRADSPVFVRNLDKLLSSKYSQEFTFRVEVEKNDLSEYLNRTYRNFSHLVWVRIENFWSYVQRDTLAFMTSVWVSPRFPRIVALDLGSAIKCRFLEISSKLSSNESPNPVAFGTFGILAKRLLDHRSALQYLFHATLLPADSKSRNLLEGRNAVMYQADDDLVNFGEEQYYDFKKRPPREIAKTVAAFANACGGVVVVGIEEGRVVGCDPNTDPDYVAESLKEVSPPITYEQVDVGYNDKYVMAVIVHPIGGTGVHVLEGGARPFRYHSTTRICRYDDDVLKLRGRVCRPA